MNPPENIVIGTSACLLGHKVRYNGEAQRRNPIIENLKDSFRLDTVCPEVGIGLGVPRETIHLVDVDGETRVRDTATGERDFTDAIQTFARNTLKAHPEWSGYIGVKNSPSCGYQRVRRYGPKGNSLPSDGVGMFIAEIQRCNPLLPVEEDGRLNDAELRHSFVLRVMAYARWQRLCAEGLTPGEILEFYARHKYLLMAHSVEEYKALGRLLEDASRYGNLRGNPAGYRIGPMSKLTHVDASGEARMVDVTDKAVTQREARAQAVVRMLPATLELILSGDHEKGDVFAVARIAGIQAAKRCHELIPLCHPLSLTGIEVQLEADADNSAVRIESRCKLAGQTGVEMEALTAASVAALTIYDMCKAADRGMVISEVCLLEKRGGKTGEWIRGEGGP